MSQFFTWQQVGDGILLHFLFLSDFHISLYKLPDICELLSAHYLSTFNYNDDSPFKVAR